MRSGEKSVRPEVRRELTRKIKECKETKKTNRIKRKGKRRRVK